LKAKLLSDCYDNCDRYIFHQTPKSQKPKGNIKVATDQIDTHFEVAIATYDTRWILQVGNERSIKSAGHGGRMVEVRSY
jgi:hypothetical protein